MAGVPGFCIETRHAQAVPSAQASKTERSGARGIAQMVRVGLFKPAHVELASQEVCALPGGRHFLQASMIDIENSIGALLRN